MYLMEYIPLIQLGWLRPGLQLNSWTRAYVDAHRRDVVPGCRWMCVSECVAEDAREGSAERGNDWSFLPFTNCERRETSPVQDIRHLIWFLDYTSPRGQRRKGTFSHPTRAFLSFRLSPSQPGKNNSMQRATSTIIWYSDVYRRRSKSEPNFRSTNWR